MNNKIDDIIRDLKLDTDKNTSHSYTEIYWGFFQPYLDKEINFLEIGIQSGGSSALWCRLFPKAKFIWIDVASIWNSYNIALMDYKRGLFIKADAYDMNTSVAIEDRFDIIIDDGSHKLSDQMACIDLYLPKLKDDGIMVIEDLQKYEDVHDLASRVPDGYGYSVFDLRFHKMKYDDIIFMIRKTTTL